MGEARAPAPAALVLAAFSCHRDALEWACQRSVARFGPIVRQSPLFSFRETRYYEPTMGPELEKVFYLFEEPFDPAALAEVKLQTNAWEREYAALGRHEEPRPLNLDPGYLTPGKLVLASTKDFFHRIYLSRGIYAEVTLFYRHGRWQHHDWTFPDYRRADYQRFFSECRGWLLGRLREGWAG
ncbi:MAG TPA: DUF4416 family protein [Planctomycetaceae bacterium]|nr:DUF4416 family protein [Planctomycetaceae bacterium]